MKETLDKSLQLRPADIQNLKVISEHYNNEKGQAELIKLAFEYVALNLPVSWKDIQRQYIEMDKMAVEDEDECVIRSFHVLFRDYDKIRQSICDEYENFQRPKVSFIARLVLTSFKNSLEKNSIKDTTEYELINVDVAELMLDTTKSMLALVNAGEIKTVMEFVEKGKALSCRKDEVGEGVN